MKKCICFIAVLAGLLLLPRLSFCQQLDDRELAIYYEYVERGWALTQSNGTEEDFEKALQDLYKDFEKKYGLSSEELDKISQRAWEYGLTAHEQEIFNEMQDRLSVVVKPPLGAPAQEYDKWAQEEESICQEVADKYGITLNVLYDIEERTKKQDKK